MDWPGLASERVLLFLTMKLKTTTTTTKSKYGLMIPEVAWQPLVRMRNGSLCNTWRCPDAQSEVIGVTDWTAWLGA